MTLQVFISYKSEYRDFARKVRDQIQGWGYGTWFDVDNIPKGAYFRHAIQEGLDGSDVLVGVITEEAQKSREVMAEVDYFLSQEKPLVPLKHGEFKPLYIFFTIQWIDFNADEGQAFSALQDRLRELQAKTGAAAKPVTGEHEKASDAKPPPPPPAEALLDAAPLAPGAPEPAQPPRQSSDDEQTDLLPAREKEGKAEASKPQPAPSVPFATSGAGLPAMQPQAPSIYAPLPATQAPRSRSAGGLLGTILSVLALPFAAIAALIGWVQDRLRPGTRDEAQLARTNRQRMLQKVYDFWIVGVLENALKESWSFDVGLAAAPGAVLRHLDYGDYPLQPNARISDVFEDLHRELLILGAPGAGKTILLLQLAQDLIAQARGSEQKAIPIVFNLASWAAERKPLTEWLVGEMGLKYQVPQKVARNWVENQQLTLLLDGLDEVAEQYRNDCVEAINAFRLQHTNVDLAVCSRIADYTILTSKLDLRGAITLQPLSTEQINAYIDRPELSALRETLASDATLQEMASTPFLLNTMAYAYAGFTLADLQIPAGDNPAKARRTHLFDVYVQKRLASSSSTYTPSQARHYLGWLARKMVEFKQSVFYIESLQPDWLQSPATLFSYRLAAGLAVGLLAGLAFALAFALESGLAVGLAVGLVFGLSYGLMFALFSGPLRIKEKGKIGLTETFSWSWSWHSFQITLTLGAAIALLAALVTGLLAGLEAGLVSGLLTALLMLAYALLGGLLNGLKSAESVARRVHPNQGIRHTLRNALRFGLMVGLAFGAAVGLMGARDSNLAFFLALGVLGGLLLGGGLSVLKHVALRLILTRSRVAPLNYARFLDYGASINLLRKVGGGYIFVHRYLLEYFAELRQ